ncbi:MAG: cupin domain-containing protein, partial [Turicibacter sp.]|nr:cupin domain-containing protein [Turicibacter sp.]
MTIQIYEFNLDQQKKELEIRGTPMFPCAAYHSDIVNNVTKDIPWHWHEEIEVIVIKKGTIQIGVNGQYLTLKEGEGIFINSNVLHAAKVLEDGTYLLNSLVFHSSLISGGTESIFEQRYVRPLLLCEQIPYLLFNHSEMWHHEAIQCTENAYDTYKKMNYGYELLIRNYLSNLWYLISIHAQPIISKSFKYELLDTSRLKLMMNYLHDHY